MNSLPRISIVTPVLNAETTVVQTITSVLSQDYPDLEYIIVDGGSTDRTLKRIKPFRGQLKALISEPDSGMYDALNKGFDLATGEILAYLNADDYYLWGALRRVGRYFRDHPEVDVVYHEDIVEIDGWLFPNVEQPHIDARDLLRGHILFQDGVFFSYRAFRAVGPFNHRLRLAGDWEMWMRLACRFPFRRLAGHVSCFRIREGQLTSVRGFYDRELEESRRAFVARSKGALRAAKLGWARPNWLRNLYRRLFINRRLFFPLPSAEIPPARGRRSGPIDTPAVCPITEQEADRLLFSSMDTRFGDEGIHHWFLVPTEDTAVCHPPMKRESLRKLYERNYSKRRFKEALPVAEGRSPYKRYLGEARFIRGIAKWVLPASLRRILGVEWGDSTASELLHLGRRHFSVTDGEVDFLDIGSFEGHLLEELRERTHWKLSGIELNEKAVLISQRKGFEIWQARAEEAVTALPAGRQFDLIFMGQTIEHLDEPLLAIESVRQLLKPSGILVLSTPNLNSWQIDLFGPTWSHWHPPYHRHLFSLNSLKRLGAATDLTLKRWRTFSYPYWSAMSLQLNELGVAGAVPHDIEVPEAYRSRAESLTAWSKLLWDWRGRGDNLYVVYAKKR